MPNLLGIENVKQLVAFLSLTSRSAFGIDSDNDGEVSNGEKLQFAYSVIPALLGIVPAFKSIQAELARGEFTSDEFDELIDYTIALDFLGGGRGDIEDWLDKLLDLVKFNKRFVQDTLELFRKDEDDGVIVDGGDTDSTGTQG